MHLSPWNLEYEIMPANSSLSREMPWEGWVYVW
jgi:hypothetical protein